jgi:hypothetical protein
MHVFEPTCRCSANVLCSLQRLGCITSVISSSTWSLDENGWRGAGADRSGLRADQRRRLWHTCAAPRPQLTHPMSWWMFSTEIRSKGRHSVIIDDEEEVSEEEEEEEGNVTAQCTTGTCVLNRDAAAATVILGQDGPMPESKTPDSSHGSAAMIQSPAKRSHVVTRPTLVDASVHLLNPLHSLITQVTQHS